jgi:YVTN family beta-propeller protein
MTPRASKCFAVAALLLLAAAFSCDARALRLHLAKKLRLGAWPKVVQTSADGRRVFVALYLDEKIAVVDRKTLANVVRFAVGGRPESLALSPDQKHLYVSLGDRAMIEVRLSEPPFTRVASIPVPARPRGLALDSTGRRLFAACARTGTLAVVDTEARRVTETIDVGWSPRAVAFVPKTERVLVVHDVGHSLYVLDARSLRILHRIKGFGRRPLGVVASRDGRTAFVPSSKKKRVFEVELESGRITSSRVAGKGPAAVALSSDEKTLFVALWDEQRIALLASGGTRAKKRFVRTCREPAALHVSRSGKSLYVACPRSHAVWVYSVK